MKHYATVPNATIASTSLSTNNNNKKANNNNNIYCNSYGHYNNTYESCVNYRSHDNCFDAKRCDCHCNCGNTVEATTAGGTVARVGKTPGTHHSTSSLVDAVDSSNGTGANHTVDVLDKHNHTLKSHKYGNHLNHIPAPATVDGGGGGGVLACGNCVESQTEKGNCCCGASAALLSAENSEGVPISTNAPATVSKTFNFSNNNNRDCFSTFQQQQQFAFFPNATEKVMANTRRVIVLSIYASSLVLSIVLFLLAGVYCQMTGCSIVWAEKNRQYAQFFPICASCLIAFLSTCWLISNFRRVETSCMREYSFLEMPTAVFSSLLAGVCAVIEIHYNFDYSYLYWSEKWALAAADSVILVFLHAGLAFALT